MTLYQKYINDVESVPDGNIVDDLILKILRGELIDTSEDDMIDVRCLTLDEFNIKLTIDTKFKEKYG